MSYCPITPRCTKALLILAMLLPYSLGAMNIAFITRTSAYLSNKIWSPKSLGNLSFSEVQKLAHNKEFAQKELKSALLRHEDTKIAPISRQPSDVTNVWKNVFSQFSIQDWNSMLLEREEQSILETIDRRLPDFVKTINFKENKEINKRIERVRAQVELLHKAQPLDESLQQYYRENLHAAGYNSKIPAIYQWSHKRFKVSCIYPHTYVTSDFFDFPLDERLGILAHENEHAKNFHIYKKLNICSFLEEQNKPKVTIYPQFTEKEADLKASAHSIAIATGLLRFFRILEEISGDSQEKSENPGPLASHPPLSKRINYTQDLIGKLEQEQKGYSWNPFHKTVGLPEWLKRY